MISPDLLSSYLHKKNALNAKCGLRQLVVLSGDFDWALSYLKVINVFKNSLPNIQTLDNSCLIYSDTPQLPSNVSTQNYRHKLGTQSQVVIYKDECLHLDILCALAGTLVSGGVLFVILKQVESSQNTKGFLQRFWKKTYDNDFVCCINQYESALIPFNDSNPLKGGGESFHNNNRFLSVDFPLGTRSQEQYQAVLAILNVAKGHRNRPLVLTADRGRGKSSALAIACAELIESEPTAQNIVVCAPHSNSLSIFFSQLSKSLDKYSPLLKGNTLLCGESKVQFIPIDELVQTKVDARIVLIDEAASIPVYLLVAIANKYSRLVFSSTVHGYEGAGRGFGVIFQKALKALSPEMQSFHMKEPIRWSAEDPLEKFISDLCLLDASLPKLDVIESKDINEFLFQRLTSYELMNNDILLNDVFAILVTAHYQTSPNDLKLLLENPKVHTLILRDENQVVAVALVMEEGADLECDIKDIQEGKRRVKDQFLPQSLLSHLGVKNSFDYSYHRILRIAVHPEIQNVGVGSYFMEKIQRYSKNNNVDFIGASFGLSSTLLSFWLKAGFNITRIGFSKDKASGEYSVMMMEGVSSNSEALQEHLSSGFYQQFNYLLTDEYADLPAQIVNQILSSCPEAYLPELSEFDLQAVTDFALSYRQYSCCVLGVHHWLQHHLVTKNNDQSYLLETPDALIMRVLQKRSVSDICKALGFTGKKALQSYMVEYVKKHIA